MRKTATSPLALHIGGASEHRVNIVGQQSPMERTDGVHVTSTRAERRKLTRAAAADLITASRNTEVLGHIHPRSRRRLVEAQLDQAEAIDPQAQAAADSLRLKAQAIAEGGAIPADALQVDKD